MPNDMREGDIEALRRSMKDEGRPLMSTIIRNKDDSLSLYKVKDEGKVEITETVKNQ